MQPVCHILFLTTISNGFLMLESLNLNMQFPLSLELRQSRVDGRSCVPLIFNCFKYNGHLGHVSTHIYVYRHVVNVALISSLMSLRFSKKDVNPRQKRQGFVHTSFSCWFRRASVVANKTARNLCHLFNITLFLSITRELSDKIYYAM